MLLYRPAGGARGAAATPASSSATTPSATRCRPRSARELPGARGGRPRRRGRAGRPAGRAGAAPRRAATCGCWRRPTGPADGWRPTSSTGSAATAASRCSTRPTRRCEAALDLHGLDLRRVLPRRRDPRPATAAAPLRRTRCAAPRRRPRPPSTTCSPRSTRPGSWRGRPRCSAVAAVAHRDPDQALRRRRPGRGRSRRPGHRPVPAPVPVRRARRDGAGDVRGVRPAGVAQLRARHDRRPRRRHGALPAPSRRRAARGLGDDRRARARRDGRDAAVGAHRRRFELAPGPSWSPPTRVPPRPAARRRRAADERADHALPRPAAAHRRPSRCCTWTAPAARWSTRGHDAAAPGYSPDGRALVASSIVGTPIDGGEAAVRRELARICGVPTDDWDAPAHRRGPARPCRCSRPGVPCAATWRWATACTSRATTATPRPPRARWSAAAAPPRPS